MTCKRCRVGNGWMTCSAVDCSVESCPICLRTCEGCGAPYCVFHEPLSEYGDCCSALMKSGVMGREKTVNPNKLSARGHHRNSDRHLCFGSTLVSQKLCAVSDVI
ncbi:hypothetical protein M427DRAFT_371415 [Gonapodya prolifera JEL478]|uniref:Uncharacterized protein n=1 Tax=Gonapodya prolifera (strain JEL478) TaxID=1344416 RepID=A0A139A9A8_GONPJ|nr:hypothetical protein M427DRAFT_371415 [Gonapodya prolifera JEL478]|eukprot:KXS13411.1 hypothetical protein M427DRAFT_371415 [Gonapodya prolifera JEL478]